MRTFFCPRPRRRTDSGAEIFGAEISGRAKTDISREDSVLVLETEVSSLVETHFSNVVETHFSAVLQTELSTGVGEDSVPVLETEVSAVVETEVSPVLYAQFSAVARAVFPSI